MKGLLAVVVVASACSSGTPPMSAVVPDAAAAGGDPDAASELLWGVRLHLTDGPPAASSAPGIRLMITDLTHSPSDRNGTAEWPPATGIDGPGARGQVLHSCSGSAPIEITLETCHPSNDGPSCLSLTLRRSGASGSLTRPGLGRCEIRSAEAELSFARIDGVDAHAAGFRASDRVVGTFAADCYLPDGPLRLEGTVNVPDFRQWLAC
jgi:hypothetical protein